MPENTDGGIPKRRLCVNPDRDRLRDVEEEEPGEAPELPVAGVVDGELVALARDAEVAARLGQEFASAVIRRAVGDDGDDVQVADRAALEAYLCPLRRVVAHGETGGVGELAVVGLDQRAEREVAGHLAKHQNQAVSLVC